MSNHFTHYANLWTKTRDPLAGKPLQNNTRLYKRANDCFAVRLHSTDVVTIFEDGRISLNTGGWYTVTTKERIGSYAPVRIRSDRGVWYVIHDEARNRAARKFVKMHNVPGEFIVKVVGGGLYITTYDHMDHPEYDRIRGLDREIHTFIDQECSVPFFDGIMFTKTGRCTNGISPAKWRAYLKARDEMTKRVQDYCTGYNRRLGTIGGIPFETDNVLLEMGARQDGHEAFSNEILLKLMDGKHYVPSLAYEALLTRGYTSDGAQIHLHMSHKDTRIGGPDFRVNDGSMGGNLVRRALRSYLFDRLLPKPPSISTDGDIDPIVQASRTK